MLMENGICGSTGCIRQARGFGGTRLHAAQDAGEAHINIVLAAFVPASYLAVAPLSHWPDVLSAARHVGHGSAVASNLSSQSNEEERILLKFQSDANNFNRCKTKQPDSA